MFLKSAAPIIIEFLKGRSSRSITIERGEDKITVTGDSANQDQLDRIWRMLETNPPEQIPHVTVQQSDKLWPALRVTLRDSEDSET